MVEALPLIDLFQRPQQRLGQADGIQAVHGIGKGIQELGIQKIQQGIHEFRRRLLRVVVKAGQDVGIVLAIALFAVRIVKGKKRLFKLRDIAGDIIMLLRLCLFGFGSLEPSLPVGFSVHDALGQQADRQRCERINHGVLLDKRGGHTDQHSGDHHKSLPCFRHILLLQPYRDDAHGIGHVQRWAHIGVGIKEVQKRNALGQKIVPGELGRPQILTIGKENIYDRGHNLRDDDKGLKPFEAIHIVQEKIQQRANNQQIPKHIRD